MPNPATPEASEDGALEALRRRRRGGAAPEAPSGALDSLRARRGRPALPPQPYTSPDSEPPPRYVDTASVAREPYARELERGAQPTPTRPTRPRTTIAEAARATVPEPPGFGATRIGGVDTGQAERREAERERRQQALEAEAGAIHRPATFGSRVREAGRRFRRDPLGAYAEYATALSESISPPLESPRDRAIRESGSAVGEPLDISPLHTAERFGRMALAIGPGLSAMVAQAMRETPAALGLGVPETPGGRFRRSRARSALREMGAGLVQQVGRDIGRLVPYGEALRAAGPAGAEISAGLGEPHFDPLGAVFEHPFETLAVTEGSVKAPAGTVMKLSDLAATRAKGLRLGRYERAVAAGVKGAEKLLEPSLGEQQAFKVGETARLIHENDPIRRSMALGLRAARRQFPEINRLANQAELAYELTIAPTMRRHELRRYTRRMVNESQQWAFLESTKFRDETVRAFKGLNRDELGSFYGFVTGIEPVPPTASPALVGALDWWRGKSQQWQSEWMRAQRLTPETAWMRRWQPLRVARYGAESEAELQARRRAETFKGVNTEHLKEWSSMGSPEERARVLFQPEERQPGGGRPRRPPRRPRPITAGGRDIRDIRGEPPPPQLSEGARWWHDQIAQAATDARARATPSQIYMAAHLADLYAKEWGRRSEKNPIEWFKAHIFGAVAGWSTGERGRTLFSYDKPNKAAWRGGAAFRSRLRDFIGGEQFPFRTASDAVTEAVAARGKPVEEVASELGVTPTELGRIMAGERAISPEFSNRLESVLGVSKKKLQAPAALSHRQVLDRLTAPGPKPFAADELPFTGLRSWLVHQERIARSAPRIDVAGKAVIKDLAARGISTTQAAQLLNRAVLEEYRAGGHAIRSARLADEVLRPLLNLPRYRELQAALRPAIESTHLVRGVGRWVPQFSSRGLKEAPRLTRQGLLAYLDRWGLERQWRIELQAGKSEAAWRELHALQATIQEAPDPSEHIGRLATILRDAGMPEEGVRPAAVQLYNEVVNGKNPWSAAMELSAQVRSVVDLQRVESNLEAALRQARAAAKATMQQGKALRELYEQEQHRAAFYYSDSGDLPSPQYTIPGGASYGTLLTIFRNETNRAIVDAYKELYKAEVGEEPRGAEELMSHLASRPELFEDFIDVFPRSGVVGSPTHYVGSSKGMGVLSHIRGASRAATDGRIYGHIDELQMDPVQNAKAMMDVEAWKGKARASIEQIKERSALASELQRLTDQRVETGAMMSPHNYLRDHNATARDLLVTHPFSGLVDGIVGPRSVLSYERQRAIDRAFSGGDQSLITRLEYNGLGEFAHNLGWNVERALAGAERAIEVLREAGREETVTATANWVLGRAAEASEHLDRARRLLPYLRGLEPVIERARAIQAAANTISDRLQQLHRDVVRLVGGGGWSPNASEHRGLTPNPLGFKAVLDHAARAALFRYAQEGAEGVVFTPPMNYSLRNGHGGSKLRGVRVRVAGPTEPKGKIKLERTPTGWTPASTYEHGFVQWNSGKHPTPYETFVDRRQLERMIEHPDDVAGVDHWESPEALRAFEAYDALATSVGERVSRWLARSNVTGELGLTDEAPAALGKTSPLTIQRALEGQALPPELAADLRRAVEMNESLKRAYPMLRQNARRAAARIWEVAQPTAEAVEREIAGRPAGEAGLRDMVWREIVRYRESSDLAREMVNGAFPEGRVSFDARALSSIYAWIDNSYEVRNFVDPEVPRQLNAAARSATQAVRQWPMATINDELTWMGGNNDAVYYDQVRASFLGELKANARALGWSKEAVDALRLEPVEVEYGTPGAGTRYGYRGDPVDQRQARATLDALHRAATEGGATARQLEDAVHWLRVAIRAAGDGPLVAEHAPEGLSAQAAAMLGWVRTVEAGTTPTMHTLGIKAGHDLMQSFSRIEPGLLVRPDETDFTKFRRPGSRLLQAPRGVAKGAVEMLRDGRWVLRVLRATDATTLVHESAHLFRNTLHPSLLRKAEHAFGVEGHAWSEAAEERFARAFESWMWEGRAPSRELFSVFQKFSDWLRGIYYSAPPEQLSHPMRRFFSAMLGVSGDPTNVGPQPHGMTPLVASYGAVGERIRRQREYLGMSEQALSERSGMSTERLGRLERGEAMPTSDEQRALAAALTTSPEEVQSVEPPPPDPGLEAKLERWRREWDERLERPRAGAEGGAEGGPESAREILERKRIASRQAAREREREAEPAEGPIGMEDVPETPNLKDRRVALGLSQEDLAKRSETSAYYIDMVERSADWTRYQWDPSLQRVLDALDQLEGGGQTRLLQTGGRAEAGHQLAESLEPGSALRELADRTAALSDELEAEGRDAPMYFPFVRQVRPSDFLPRFGPPRHWKPGSLRQSFGSTFASGNFIRDPKVLAVRHHWELVKYQQVERMIQRVLEDPKIPKREWRGEALGKDEELFAPDGFLRVYRGAVDFGDQLIEAVDRLGVMDDAMAAALRSAQAGGAFEATVSGVRRAKTYVLPKAVMDELRGQWSPVPKWVRLLIDRPNDIWRVGVLPLRPAWLVNNVIGGAVFSLLSGAAPHDFIRALNARFTAKTPDTVGGGITGMSSVEGRMINLGRSADSVLGKIYTVLSETPPISTIGRAADYMKLFNTRTDDFFRRASFIHFAARHARRNYMLRTGDLFFKAYNLLDELDLMAPAQIEDAVNRSLHFLNDYSRMSPWERQWLRRFVPFGSFLKHQLRLVGTMPVQYPGRALLMAAIAKNGDEIANDYAPLPQYLENKGLVDLGFSWTIRNPDTGEAKPYRVFLSTQGWNPLILGFGAAGEVRDITDIPRLVASQGAPWVQYGAATLTRRTPIGSAFKEMGTQEIDGRFYRRFEDMPGYNGKIKRVYPDAGVVEVEPPLPNPVEFYAGSFPQAQLAVRLINPNAGYSAEPFSTESQRTGNEATTRTRLTEVLRYFTGGSIVLVDTTSARALPIRRSTLRALLRKSETERARTRKKETTR